MRIDILTLFPNMFDGFLTESIIKRAIENKKVEVNIIDFRKYSKDKHHKVDDTPFGGGNGMILMCQPIFDAVKDLKKYDDTKIVLLTPDGRTYNQSIARELMNYKHLIIICGHYEGFDDRIRSVVDYEISVGDFVLTGGELPSMMVTDSIIRLLPGVISEGSLYSESFNNNLLDYPNYTQPREFEGMKVPDVLLNGNHKEIQEYRKKMQLELTAKKRPDLLNK